MTDRLSNPYASPDSPPSDVRPRRPLGTVLLAIPLLLLGLGLFAGGIIRFPRIPATNPEYFTLYLQYWLIAGVIPLAMAGASLGLLSGRRLGWWLAVSGCYVLGASFVLLPIVRRVEVVWLTAKAVFFLLWWLYLIRGSVRAFYGQAGPQRWRTHFVLFVVSVAVVFGMGLW